MLLFIDESVFSVVCASVGEEETTEEEEEEEDGSTPPSLVVEEEGTARVKVGLWTAVAAEAVAAMEDAAAEVADSCNRERVN